MEESVSGRRYGPGTLVGYQRWLKDQRIVVAWKRSVRWPGEPLQHWVGGV